MVSRGVQCCYCVCPTGSQGDQVQCFAQADANRAGSQGGELEASRDTGAESGSSCQAIDRKGRAEPELSARGLGGSAKMVERNQQRETEDTSADSQEW